MIFIILIMFPFGGSIFNFFSVGWEKIPKVFSSPVSISTADQQEMFKRVFNRISLEKSDISSYLEIFSNYNDQSTVVNLPLVDKLLQKSDLTVNSIAELKYNFFKWILIFREILKLTTQEKRGESSTDLELKKVIFQKFFVRVEEQISLERYKDVWIFQDNQLQKSKFFSLNKKFSRGAPQEVKKFSTLKMKKYRDLAEQGQILYPIEVFEWSPEYRKNKIFPWLSIRDVEKREAKHYQILGENSWVPLGQLWHNLHVSWLALGVIESKLGNKDVVHTRHFFHKEGQQIQSFESLSKKVKKMEEEAVNRGISLIRVRDILGEIPDFAISLIDSSMNTDFIRSFSTQSGQIESFKTLLSLYKVFLRILLDRIEIFLDVRDIKTGILHEEGVFTSSFSF